MRVCVDACAGDRQEGSEGPCACREPSLPLPVGVLWCDGFTGVVMVCFAVELEGAAGACGEGPDQVEAGLWLMALLVDELRSLPWEWVVRPLGVVVGGGS